MNYFIFEQNLWGDDMEKSKEKSKEFFNKNAKRYSESRDGEFTRPMYQEIIDRVMSKNPKKVLDLGCGSGNVLKELNDIYSDDLELCGLDIAEDMIKIANETLGDKADLKVGDCEDIPWPDNTFDVVVCNASFHHYPNPDKTLMEVGRVLKNNGTLILGDPTAPSVLRNILNLFIRFSSSGDFRIYNQQEIVNLLNEAGFTPKDFKLLKRNKFFINAEINK